MLKFYGRGHEITLLKRYQMIAQKTSSQMVVVSGQRRIGKTRLIFEALHSPCSEVPLLYFYVASDKTEAGNTEAFLRLHAAPLRLTGEATHFADLRSLCEYIFKRSRAQPITSVIDEFQNLKTVAPSVFGDLQEFWDRYAGQTKLFLVAAGSNVNTIQAITESLVAPLYGRPSAFIRLQPLPVSTVYQILEDYSCGTATADDHLALLMMTGGIAGYVERFMDAGCMTKERMVEFATASSSFFLLEGERLLKSAFKRLDSVNLGILEKVAKGVTDRAALMALFDKDIGAQLKQLEETSLLTIERPFRSSLQKEVAYRLVITDPFLLFWFRYLFANQSLLEMSPDGPTKLAQAIVSDIPKYTDQLVLTQYFRRELMETGTVSECAPWWNHNDGDDIDLVAYQPFDKRLIFVDVNREARQINLQRLKAKSLAFLEANPSCANCEIVYEGRSLESIKTS